MSLSNIYDAMCVSFDCVSSIANKAAYVNKQWLFCVIYPLYFAVGAVVNGS